MKKSLIVEIAGNSYQIATEDDPEYVQKLAECVTVKILEVKRDTGASALDCAVMAALEFADEYHKELQKKRFSGKKKAADESVGQDTLF